MLRRRNRSFQKDQKMGISKQGSFLKVPGLFVGFNAMFSDSDSVRSPTSPLDFRIFSSLGSPFRCPKSENEGHIKNWDSDKVGLRILDSLDHGNKTSVGQFSDNKNILFGRQMAVRGCNFDTQELPKSLPEDIANFPRTAKSAEAQKSNYDVVFEIGEATSSNNLHSRSIEADFGIKSASVRVSESKPKPVFSESDLLVSPCEKREASIPSSTHSGFTCPIAVSELELSEDYTCVTTHGPNPKVTHIFADRIVECCNDGVCDSVKTSKEDSAAVALLDDFLKFCHSCNKKLDGEDIYMYRGEKAFCSYNCRSEAMASDDDTEVEFLENQGTGDGSLFMTK